MFAILQLLEVITMCKQYWFGKGLAFCYVSCYIMICFSVGKECGIYILKWLPIIVSKWKCFRIIPYFQGYKIVL